MGKVGVALWWGKVQCLFYKVLEPSRKEQIVGTGQILDATACQLCIPLLQPGHPSQVTLEGWISEQKLILLP